MCFLLDPLQRDSPFVHADITLFAVMTLTSFHRIINTAIIQQLSTIINILLPKAAEPVPHAGAPDTFRNLKNLLTRSIP
jgi:hypothetical protein